MRASTYEVAASVLLSAAYTNDKDAAEKHGVSIRTICNYRHALQEDAKFAEYFRSKKQAFDSAWSEQLPVALTESIAFLAQVSRNAQKDPNAYRNPLLIQAVAGAMKLCAEVYYTGKLIDARIAPEDREETSVPRQDIPKALASTCIN